MKQPEFITFTGVDDRTDKDKADWLASRYPIEWGMLFSRNNKDARYPSAQTFLEFMDVSGKKSIHLCGSAAREFSTNGALPAEIEPIKNTINRMQINGARGLPFDKFPGIDLILQCKQFSDGPFYQLFDVSGGRGQMPKFIPEPKTGGLVGYAGGMGPDTVLDYLKMITCQNPVWIDMEGRVRTNGWFDLDKVEIVCRRVFG